MGLRGVSGGGREVGREPARFEEGVMVSSEEEWVGAGVGAEEETTEEEDAVVELVVEVFQVDVSSPFDPEVKKDSKSNIDSSIPSPPPTRTSLNRPSASSESTSIPPHPAARSNK